MSYYGGYARTGAAIGADLRTSLWMGDIDPSYMDDSFVRNTFLALGEHVSVKMIRDRATGGWCNYCFVDFRDNGSAVKALASLNGTPIPGTNRTFRLNWASGGGGSGASALALASGLSMGAATTAVSSAGMGGGGGGGGGGLNAATAAAVTAAGIASTMGTLAPAARLADPITLVSGPEFSIFIGDISSEVTEEMLLALFQSYYHSVKAVKVVTDPVTGMPKGYGFVRFFDEQEQLRALTEMQGVYCGSRPMRISVATPRAKAALTTSTAPNITAMGVESGPNSANVGYAGGGGGMSEYQIWAADPTNTVIVVYGFPTPLESEQHFQSLFELDGQIIRCMLYPDRSGGTLQFATRQQAEQAMQRVQKGRLGKPVLVSWSRPALPEMKDPYHVESVVELNKKFAQERELGMAEELGVWWTMTDITNTSAPIRSIPPLAEAL